VGDDHCRPRRPSRARRPGRSNVPFGDIAGVLVNDRTPRANRGSITRRLPIPGGRR
jgi:hypothetical protein